MSERNDEQQEGEDTRNYRDFDEMESVSTATDTPEFDPSAIKLEGDKVPEDMRGKSVADVALELQRARAALRISEDARIALRDSRESLENSRRPAQAPAAPAQPVEEAEMTDEQFEELYNNNPARAMKVYTDQQTRRLERRVMGEVRGSVGTLASGTAGAVEQQMRAQFPDEFAILGTEIAQFKSQVDPSVLAHPDAWAQMIDYARGKYYEKFTTEKQKRSSTTELEAARTRQREEAQPDFSRSNGGGERRERGVESLPRGRGREMDDTQKEIARTLGVPESEWKKWDF